MEVSIPEVPTAIADDTQDLTPRQIEILSLLTAGKANKEIAYELGIGLGTVKQHVVALFRKLNVTNRAMAVSRGLGRVGALAPGASPAERGPGDSIELRPVTVLSLGCSGQGDGTADAHTWQALQTAAVTSIRTVDSVLIGRPGLGVDVVFGLHRVDERDADQAVALAREVFQHFAAARHDQSPMRAAVVSGYLLASVGRYGGWTGETVAGRLVAHARAVRNEAPPDGLCIDAAAQRMLAFARRAEQPRCPAPSGRPEVRTLAAGDDGPHMRARTSRPPPLIGRKSERATLETAIADLMLGQGAALWLEGETGMGKTTLARTVAAANSSIATWEECRCGSPERSPALVLARLLRTAPTPSDLIPALAKRLRRRPAVIMVDDIQAANPAEASLLLELAALARTAPLLLLAIGRRMEEPDLASIPWTRLKLARMAATEIRALIHRIAEGHLSAQALTNATDLAAGVPLFAHELAWDARFGTAHDAMGDPNHLPLPLVCLVLSRLDTLTLDHAVLKALAWHEPATSAALSQIIGDAIQTVKSALDLAVTAGVTALESRNDTEYFKINHPLVSAVLRLVMPGGTGGSTRTKG